MSSSPLGQQLQPPPMAITQQLDAPHSGGGSIGPVIAVLAVITILGVIAGVIGRLCAGGRVFGYGNYDLEGWIERKCASCVDGRVGHDPTPPPAPLAANGAVPIAAPVEAATQGGKHQAAEQQSAAEEP